MGISLIVEVESEVKYAHRCESIENAFTHFDFYVRESESRTINLSYAPTTLKFQEFCSLDVNIFCLAMY